MKMIEDGRNISSTTNINDEHDAPASINNANEATLSAGALNLFNNNECVYDYAIAALAFDAQLSFTPL